jgi:hypothetical protein
MKINFKHSTSEELIFSLVSGFKCMLEALLSSANEIRLESGIDWNQRPMSNGTLQDTDQERSLRPKTRVELNLSLQPGLVPSSQTWH